MPLSDDQKAMLRLLAQREQGYDEMAALMGLSVEEVRAKVRDALAQLEGEGKPTPPVPPPPAAGPKASAPPEPAEVGPPPPEPETTERFERAPKPPARPPHRAGPPRPSLPADRGARAALISGAGVVIVLVVLLLTGALDGSGDETTSAAPSEPAAQAEAAAESGQVTQAILSPVGGGNANGRAIFGRVKKSLALQIEAQGLAPTQKGQSYTVWLAQSPQRMLPLASTRVDSSGRIGAQVAVPTEVLAFLAKGTFDQIVVSLTSDATLKAALTKATSEKKAPIYTGTDVLRGTVTGPIVGVAKNE